VQGEGVRGMRVQERVQGEGVRGMRVQERVQGEGVRGMRCRSVCRVRVCMGRAGACAG